MRKPFLLRIDSALLRELEAWAGEELRSVNSQIEYVLRDAVRRRKRRAANDPRHPGAPSSPGRAPEPRKGG